MHVKINKQQQKVDFIPNKKKGSRNDNEYKKKKISYTNKIQKLPVYKLF